ncbi:MAG: tetratricopeptide repeat protein [Flavobacteriales bacterium]|jgi:signal transduction histidine kinase|nr:tetratricopeptide repeat protein [Flavobacteriales bacterium]
MNWYWSQQIDSIGIGNTIFSGIGNPKKLDSIEQVIYPKVIDDYLLEETYYYTLSKARFLSGQLTEAFSHAEKGIALNQRKNKTFRSAKFYNIQASVYAYQKDYKKAIQTFKTSLEILENTKNYYTAAQVQNNIANIFFGLSDFESAYKYSKVSHDRLTAFNDTIHLPGVKGILAVTLLKLNRIPEGKKNANQALKLSKKYNNPIGLIVSNYSLGEVFIVEESCDSAIIYFKASLQLSEQFRQKHFTMLNKVGLLKAYLINKNYNEAVEVGEQALAETIALENENTLYAIHKNLGYAYHGLEKEKEAFEHISAALETYVEASSTENKKAINDILIKYDTEKKEKKLIAARLENAQSKHQLYKRTQLAIILGVVVILLLFSYYLYNRLQKEKMRQLQKEQESKRMLAAISAEEKERKRISNELHDGMASSITGIKLKLEGMMTESKDSTFSPLVSQLQRLHDETRRISHNLMPLDLNKENWAKRLEEYCVENSSDRFKIDFINNLPSTIALPPSQSILLYRSIQELIHNAQKYAGVNSCTVQLSSVKGELIISVEDEGVGFIPKDQKGQGLNSIRQRLFEIDATIDIESRIGNGSLISIYLTLPS